MDDDSQRALNQLREKIAHVEKRVLAQEIHADHYKESMQNLRNDFMSMQGNIKVDIERVQTSLHKDIKLIHDILSELIKKQAVDEAKMKTGVTAAKLFIERLPWILAVAASFAALMQLMKDKAL